MTLPQDSTVRHETVLKAPTPASTLREWASPADRRVRIAKTLEFGPLGEELGMGHWGVVYALESPWVVKITVDPTEAPMWSKLGTLDPLLMAGLARSARIVRLLPDMPFEMEEFPVFAIVREEADMFLAQVPGVVPSERTLQELGQAGFNRVRYALGKYKVNAELYHNENGAWNNVEPSVRVRSSIEGMLNYAEKLMELPGAELLGGTLYHLTSKGIALRDVHLNNIGWRKYEIPEMGRLPSGLMVTDPGHTPTRFSMARPIPAYAVNR